MGGSENKNTFKLLHLVNMKSDRNSQSIDECNSDAIGDKSMGNRVDDDIIELIDGVD